MSESIQPRPLPWRQLLLLFLAAAMLRVAWIGVRYAREDAWSRLQYPDEEAYVLSARSLAAGGGLIDEFGFRATYMPAYPAFLSLFVAMDRGLLFARLAQALLGALVAPATYLLARAFVCPHGGSSQPGSLHLAPAQECVPLIAGALAAVDPFLVFFSGLLLTEALFAVVLVAAWWVVLSMVQPSAGRAWAQAIPAGLLLALAVMLRPAAMVPIVSAAVLILVLRRFSPRTLASMLIAGLTLMAALTPWAARNARVIGEWRWLTTRGGISLYDGVQPEATGASDLAHTKTLSEVRDLTETQWDRHFADLAREEIRRDPGRILRLAGDKAARLWSLRPNVAEYHSGASGTVSQIWMIFLLVGMFIGAWRFRLRAGAMLVLLWPVLATTGMHMIFVASVRYRVPVMPMIMVLSAAGWCAMAGLFTPRRGGSVRDGEADRDRPAPSHAETL